MSDAAIKVTFKAGPGYEAPWFSVDAENPEQLQNLLSHITEGVLAEVINVSQQFSGVYSAARGLGGTVTKVESDTQARTEEKAQPERERVERTDSPTPMCNHGAMVRREGTSAKGKWGAWFCPTAKGAADKCDPIWDKKG